MKRKTAAFNSATDRKTPRLSRRRVSLAKKPSTALSQEHEVDQRWPLRCALPVKPEAALMPATSHPASHPNQDSYADGDSESDQRAVLDRVGHPVQRVVAKLGGFVAETRGLVAGQAPA